MGQQGFSIKQDLKCVMFFLVFLHWASTIVMNNTINVSNLKLLVLESTDVMISRYNRNISFFKPSLALNANFLGFNLPFSCVGSMEDPCSALHCR